MTKISEYPAISNPDLEDLLIGTDSQNQDLTKNFTLSSIKSLVLTSPNMSEVPQYDDNADALSGGLVAGDVYRTGDVLKIVHD